MNKITWRKTAASQKTALPLSTRVSPECSPPRKPRSPKCQFRRESCPPRRGSSLSALASEKSRSREARRGPATTRRGLQPVGVSLRQ